MSSGLAVEPVRRAFWIVAALLVAGKLALSALLPITGDEAYFYYWGLYPAAGYYDHPPMVGWWLNLLLRVADAEWFIRLPATLLPLFAAFVAFRIAAASSPEPARAWWAALIVLLAPVHVWNVFITTDTPLIAFSLLSVLFYLGALRRNGTPAAVGYAFAGVALGLAFLSKYFAVFLGFAFLVHVAAIRRDPGRWPNFLLLVACALPGAVFNIAWNIDNCWANVLFNLFNRHENSGLSWSTSPLYVLTLAYVLSPFALIAAWRHRTAVSMALRRRDATAALLWLALVPFLLFALLSPVKTIGLHWLLSFVPPALAGLALALPAPALPRLGRWLAGFALVHALGIAVLFALPLSTWKGARIYDGLVLTFRSQKLLDKLRPLAGEYELASDGYSNAVTLGYNARRYVSVFGLGSSHARHDDILSDPRRSDGRNIAILRKTAPADNEYAPYFSRVDQESFEVEGVRFHLIRGQGFRYPVYRDRILTVVRDRWYRIPAVLPVTACYFCDRHFPGAPYPRR